MTHPTNPNDEHGPGCDGCRELCYVRRIEELTAERDAAERRVVEIENLDDRDGAVIRANTRASAAVRASIDAEERATGLAAVIEQAVAELDGIEDSQPSDIDGMVYTMPWAKAIVSGAKRIRRTLTDADRDAALREVRAKALEDAADDAMDDWFGDRSDNNTSRWLRRRAAAIREGQA